MTNSYAFPEHVMSRYRLSMGGSENAFVMIIFSFCPNVVVVVRAESLMAGVVEFSGGQVRRGASWQLSNSSIR